MALINLTTNLKSLKFGSDQPGGGSSNQPYIQTDIPNQTSPLNGGADSDFLLRGGITAPLDAAKDVLRLSKFFIDTKSPNGLFFTLKQNLLSRTSVRTQASTGPSYGGANGGVNQGIYTPIGTLAQAGVGFTGTHLNLLGLDPSSPMSGIVNGGLFPNLGLNRYGEKITFNQEANSNRLVGLYQVKTLQRTRIPYGLEGFLSNSNNIVLSYGGGPNSILGIGKTNIYFADQRTGLNNPNTNPPENTIFTIEQVGNSDIIRTNWSKFSGKSPHGITLDYNDVLNLSNNPAYRNIKNDIDPDTGVLTRIDNVYKEDSLDSNPDKISENNTKVLTQQDIYSIGDELNNKLKIGAPSIIDFRRRLPNNKDFTSPAYSGSEAKNIETRVYLGDPGNNTIKDLNSYTKGSGIGPLDKINASKLNKDRDKIIYDSDGAEKEGKSNDLVKFRIASLDSGGGSERIYMHFRALLDSFNDAYSADWQPQKYLGRGENFYSYNGFDRKISLSWTVYAQSKEELIPMYKKLNYLASNLAPDYSKNGYMRGPLVSLTLGGYLYEQPGFITSLTYDIPMESTWEIGINDTDGTSDKDVKELAHMIKVTGFSFTPIHYFVPRKANPDSLGSTPFIALTTKERGPGNYA